ncbi:putative telomere length regulator protein (Rif1) [Aspergillus lucknowensis]|uniref:Rap1-interacting factor 1 N terminal-domain-containing protein n=1 Tax=Aspergillus lucknowensis TaxID=176173 RepID=A0ABR4M071_9EURO
MVDVLGPLSARPPTPPRTASRVLSEKDRLEESPVIAKAPIESPLVPKGSTGAPSSGQSKRVNFSPWPKYIKPPSFTNVKSRALLPSNECKPARSILKSTNSPAPVCSTVATSYTPETFAMLLESVTQQLAGESTSSRIDAYMQFFGALRAYEKLPTEEGIVHKLGLITQFIQRDINRDLGKGGPLDTNLVIQALKLSVVLVWHSQISPHLPDDFKLFLVEHSVNCLEDGKLPKSVVTHYLSVISTQKFQARIMTNTRASRILTVLHGLTDRVKGNAVVSQRLMIYERIFEQCKSAFMSHSALWMDHLISGLLHHVKDVRLKAIELGFKAYMGSGSNPALSKTLRDIFDRTLDSKRKLASEICERMSRMMANSETGEHVPRIWGVLTLLLRSKRFDIVQWPHFKEWVLVLQKCFNCSDPEIKSKAIGNWDRFVLVVNINDTTSRSLLRMLSKPILSQFERKKQDRPSSQPSQLAVSSYYNLLYYAFRPDASFQQLDIVWQEYIASPSSSIFSFVPNLSDRVALALSNMLWSSHPLKAWSDNRVNEPRRISAEELPILDCKWVRSRLSAVLGVFEDILKSSIWGPEINRSNIAFAWLNLSQALALAASKEITPSPESMQAIGNVLGFLERIWNAGPPSLNAVHGSLEDTFFDRFRYLSTTMVVNLGNIPVTEKLLLKTAESTYQTVNTPTHRHSRTNRNPDSPFIHLLRLISDAQGISKPTIAYSEFIHAVVEAACRGRGSRSSRLDILRQCASLCCGGREFYFAVTWFAEKLWKSTADLSADCLSSFPIEPTRERDGAVRRDYDNVVQILSAGCRFSDSLSVWDRLMDAFTRVLRTEKGDRAVADLGLLPLTTAMTSLKASDAYLPAASVFKHCLTIPFSDKEDTATTEQRTESKEPPFPTGLVGFAHQVLEDSSQQFGRAHPSGLAVFIESIASFLGSGSANFRFMLLESLQEPLGLYVKDTSNRLTADDGVESRFLTACRSLATAVLNILQIAPRNDATLDRFEHILSSGLGSAHLSTAKRFLEFWGSAFGLQQPLNIPATISLALRDLETRIGSQPPELPEGQSQVVNVQRQGRNLETDDGQGIEQRGDSPVEVTTITSNDMSAKSRIAFVSDAPSDSSRPVRMESLSVAKAPEPAAPVPRQTTEPIAPPALQGDAPRDDLEMEDIPHPAADNKGAARHSEVFSMIDNLRSSSPPTNTPRELGIMTPPHLRSLRNECSSAETPKTPTVPAVSMENEDGFLGSSPTPAVRVRTSLVAYAIPPTISAADGGSMELDPPSSPPEVDGRAPTSQQQSPSQSSAVRERVGKNKKRSRPKRPRNPRPSNKENVSTESPQYEQNKQRETSCDSKPEKTLRSRLRSAADRIPASTEDAAARDVQKAPETPCNDSSHVPQAASVLGNGVTNSAPESPRKTDPEPAEAIVYSSSDELDTQATSQLEYDLVSAVDMRSDPAVVGVADALEQAPAARKRKREDVDTSTQSNNERRRSSRLSSTAAPPTEIGDSQPALFKKQKVSAIVEVSTFQAGNGVEDRHDGIVDMSAKSPRAEHRIKKEKDGSTSTETQEPLQKRRSSRISGAPAPDIPEEIPVLTKSPWPSSVRKQTNKQKAGKSARRKSKPVAERVSKDTTAGEASPEQSDERIEPRATNQGSQQPSGLPNPSPAEPPPSHEPEGPEEPHEIQMAEAQAVPESIVAASEPHEVLPENQAASQPTQWEPDPSPALPEPAQETGPEPSSAPHLSPDSQLTTSLRTLLDHVKAATLDRNTVREMDDLLFELRVEMHEAMRRHRGNTTPPAMSQEQ